MNEEKRQTYSVTYTINGIYGEVSYTRYLTDFTEEMLYDTIAELKSANEEILKINHFNFYILDEDEKFECESIKIYGLPFGIDFNTYYKMAMLRDIKSLKPSTGTTSINFSAEVEKATNIAISKIKEGLIKSGM